MALKLTKGESNRQAALVVELRTQEGKMQDAINVFNTALESARVDLRDACDKYNEILSDVKGFAEDIASRIGDEIDSKSEKWQEGEKCAAATAWKGEWEEVDPEDLDADLIAPTDIEDFNFEAADALEAISSEPEDV